MFRRKNANGEGEGTEGAKPKGSWKKPASRYQYAVRFEQLTDTLYHLVY